MAFFASTLVLSALIWVTVSARAAVGWRLWCWPSSGGSRQAPVFLRPVPGRGLILLLLDLEMLFGPNKYKALVQYQMSPRSKLTDAAFYAVRTTVAIIWFGASGRELSRGMGLVWQA